MLRICRTLPTLIRSLHNMLGGLSSYLRSTFGLGMGGRASKVPRAPVHTQPACTYPTKRSSTYRLSTTTMTIHQQATSEKQGHLNSSAATSIGQDSNEW